MSTPMIEVRHLKKYFDTPKGMLHAVDDVTFKIGKGRTMGVVGESGCGKSTLGRTMIHLLESTDGQILMNGEDITRVDKKKLHEINEKMQIVFQDPYSSLNPRQTVEEIIREPLTLCRRYKSRAEIDEKQTVLTMITICFCNFSNRYTLSQLTGCDLNDPAVQETRKKQTIDIMLSYLRAR